MFDYSLKKALDALSGLTKMHCTLYDDKQRSIVSSSNHDRLLSIIKSDSKIQELYEEFIVGQLKIALERYQPFFVEGLTGQHHAFIPLHCEGQAMIVLAEGFYASAEDFKRFYFSSRGQALGVAERTEEEWLKDIPIYSYEEIIPVLENVRSVLQTLITSESKNQNLNKRYRQAKTIISIMSDIDSDYSVHNIYQIVIDAIIFLFEIDTATILVKKDGEYLPEVLEGRKKRLIQDLRISDDNRLIAKVAETSVLAFDSHELLQAGFPEDINLLTMFPFTSDAGLLGILAIFNSSLDDETCKSITDLCRLAAYLCRIRRKKEELEAASGWLNVHSIHASSLYSLYREPRLLYEGIVSEASSLADAEKCSLMMSDGNGMLEVQSARGINMALMENVRVRRGEGISGKVYEQGLPVLITGEKDLKNYGNTPRSHYKTSSSLSMPLKVADEIIGVLNLSDKRSGISFAQTDVSMLSPFILQASALLKLGIYHDSLEEMKKLSMTDSLTGLFNRRYFDIRLEEEYLRAKRYNLILSLAIMDIDDFKLFNDTEGHIAGDGILKEVAYIMTAAIRSHDILARFGGEEFTIIMPQTSEAEALSVSERIRENIKSNIKPAWKRCPKKRLTVSSGIATYPECGPTKEEIIRCADNALYKAKSLGKDRTIS